MWGPVVWTRPMQAVGPRHRLPKEETAAVDRKTVQIQRLKHRRSTLNQNPVVPSKVSYHSPQPRAAFN